MSLLPPPHVIRAFMKHCHCCPCCQNPPCDGIMAAGLCDKQNCVYDDEDGDDWRDDGEEDT